MWAPELPSVRPRFPSRLRAFTYGCGKVAAILDGKMKVSQQTVAAPRRPPEDKTVVLPPGVRDPRS